MQGIPSCSRRPLNKLTSMPTNLAVSSFFIPLSLGEDGVSGASFRRTERAHAHAVSAGTGSRCDPCRDRTSRDDTEESDEENAD